MSTLTSHYSAFSDYSYLTLPVGITFCRSFVCYSLAYTLVEGGDTIWQALKYIFTFAFEFVPPLVGHLLSVCPTDTFCYFLVGELTLDSIFFPTSFIRICICFIASGHLLSLRLTDPFLIFESANWPSVVFFVQFMLFFSGPFRPTFAHVLSLLPIYIIYLSLLVENCLKTLTIGFPWIYGTVSDPH